MLLMWESKGEVEKVVEGEKAGSEPKANDGEEVKKDSDDKKEEKAIEEVKGETKEAEKEEGNTEEVNVEKAVTNSE